MASLNKVILIGHLTADPELKQTATGTPLSSFSIGVTRRFTRQGEQPPVRFYQHRRLAEHSGVYQQVFPQGECHLYLRFHPDPQL